MGYCSEIGILITLPKNKTSEKIVNELTKLMSDFKDNFDITHKDNWVYCHTKMSLKWYSSYEDVKAVMEWINDFEDNYKTGGIHYLRIGESIEDIEEKVLGKPEKYIELFRGMDIEN